MLLVPRAAYRTIAPYSNSKLADYLCPEQFGTGKLVDWISSSFWSGSARLAPPFVVNQRPALDRGDMHEHLLLAGCSQRTQQPATGARRHLPPAALFGGRPLSLPFRRGPPLLCGKAPTV